MKEIAREYEKSLAQGRVQKQEVGDLEKKVEFLQKENAFLAE
jgi:hypothetical protein